MQVEDRWRNLHPLYGFRPVSKASRKGMKNYFIASLGQSIGDGAMSYRDMKRLGRMYLHTGK